MLVAGLAGTLLGSVLQWAQSSAQARRERKREKLAWSREDRRLWAEKRQRIYLDTIAVARRQIMSMQEGPFRQHQILGRELPDLANGLNGVWHRSPEVLNDWNQRLAEIEFYGSDDVRLAVAQLDSTLDMLEAFLPPGNAWAVMAEYAETLYAKCVSLMRHDLGLSEGGRVDLADSRDEVMLHVMEALDQPDGPKDLLPKDLAD